MRIIKAEGVESLTMTLIARRLRVTPAALYNHATSKAVILGWVQEDLLAHVDVSSFETEPWLTAIEKWGASYFDVMVMHPGLISTIATAQLQGARDTIRMRQTIARALMNASWPTATVIPTIASLEAYILGAALIRSADGATYDAGVEAVDCTELSSSVEEGRALWESDEPFPITFSRALREFAMALARVVGVASPAT